MMDLYVVFENGIDENEWWLMGVFVTKAEAKEYVDDLVDNDSTSTYRIVKYVCGEKIKG